MLVQNKCVKINKAYADLQAGKAFAEVENTYKENDLTNVSKMKLLSFWKVK